MYNILEVTVLTTLPRYMYWLSILYCISDASPANISSYAGPPSTLHTAITSVDMSE